VNRQEAVDFIRSSALAEHADALIQHLAPSARLIVGDSAERADHLTVSHFGGLPSLPENAAWPVWDKRQFLTAEIASLEKRYEAHASKSWERPERIPGSRERRSKSLIDKIAKNREQLRIGEIPLAFLGQLSLREINAVAPLPGWPNTGTLAFFYDSSWLWGFSPVHRGHCRVVFLPEDLPTIPATFPEHLPTGARFSEYPLSAQCEWVLPPYLELDDGNLALRKTREYRELLLTLNSTDPDQKNPVHRCGGFSQEIQGDMALECQLVTHGLYCGDRSGYEDPRRTELEQGVHDWQLLVQFDSDEKYLGWMWGDIGRVYFWARRQEIEAADFSNTWAILQCY
jgi:uncharacterized protein YwqG